ncbi:DUF4873 domain-containing protein [Actinacidiphila guanduensis]|jgi:hypothetical protein|uniref:DUF4873 domain-containing protein n=1 Tax=Actinacidiphila guanduensis TaxID=310781 RepID=A0A1H0HGV6_9ACTN|nr:DUF4873 domain-containing protein [Actinacidiphila guanduensis]SDO18435.1 protein of unknown function [Actinacidiphila guanduensis]
MEDDGYDGPAVVIVGEERFATRARLLGQFQPLDGRYRWYGRLAADEALTRLVGDRGAAVILRTEEGFAEGRIGEPDLWNRYRIEGESAPPFHVPFGVEDVEPADDH